MFQCQNEDGTELLEVTLDKGDDGLGITVAGYVSPDSTNNGKSWTFLLSLFLCLLEHNHVESESILLC